MEVTEIDPAFVPPVPTVTVLADADRKENNRKASRSRDPYCLNCE
jgi:hypothetical protein